jgi:hypothetical protein
MLPDFASVEAPRDLLLERSHAETRVRAGYADDLSTNDR